MPQLGSRVLISVKCLQTLPILTRAWGLGILGGYNFSQIPPSFRSVLSDTHFIHKNKRLSCTRPTDIRLSHQYLPNINMSASTSNIRELEKPETGHAGIISQNCPYPQQRKANVEKDGPDQETTIELPRPEANEYPKGLTLFFLVWLFL